jgi:mono/diheme cytochrome c family protein
VNGVAVAPPPGLAGGPAGSSGSAGTGGFVVASGPQPTIPLTVTTASKPVPPISGGTLLITADGSTAVAADQDRDQVYLVDLASKAVRTIALNVGDEPGRIVEDGAGRLHVALRRGGAVATIDPKTATVTARQAACPAPRGLAYQAAGDLVYVACTGGELVSLPAAGGAATRSVKLDRDLRDVVVGANGTLLVSTFRTAAVIVVGADGTESSRLTPGSGQVKGIMGPQTRTPSVAWRMVSLGDTMGGVVMLHQTGITDTVDPAAGGYAGLMGCGGIVQPGVSVLTPGGSMPPVAGGLGNLSVAVDVAVSPDHSKVAIAAPGNAETPGQSTLVEASVPALTQTTAPPCGGPTQNIIGSPPPGQVVSVAYSNTQPPVLFAQTREPATLWRSDMATTTISLASDSRADTGHLIFHANAGGGLACASCHPEGGEDGRVWNFVCAGARRTQSIRGGISATAPFHWDGSEHDFSHLMDDVFTGRMAGPMLSDLQKNALQSWVDTIPALPPAAGLDAASVARGSTLFNDPKVGCATCHAGSLLTNNATVDVGTGQPLQVPSLRGVSWRAPFMHSGCAATLADRFTDASCGGGDKHGVTSTLTAAQVSDLTAYLQSL